MLVEDDENFLCKHTILLCYYRTLLTAQLSLLPKKTRPPSGYHTASPPLTLSRMASPPRRSKCFPSSSDYYCVTEPMYDTQSTSKCTNFRASRRRISLFLSEIPVTTHGDNG